MQFNGKTVTCEDGFILGMRVKVLRPQVLHGSFVGEYEKNGFLYVVHKQLNDSCLGCSYDPKGGSFITVAKCDLEPILEYRGEFLTCENICFKGLRAIVLDPDTNIKDEEMKKSYHNVAGMVTIVHPQPDSDRVLVAIGGIYSGLGVLEIPKHLVVPFFSDDIENLSIEYYQKMLSNKITSAQVALQEVNSLTKNLKHVKSFG